MTNEGEGTQAATISTEHTLLDLTTSKVFVPFVDLGNLASGDTVEIRVYTKVKSGGTLNCIYFASFTDAQSSNGGLVQVGIPVPSDHEWKFTLKQTAGTGRNFDWKVVSI